MIIEGFFCLSRDILALNFDHKVCGAVSVIMEGVYPGWPIYRLNNTIGGCSNCYEGLFRQISGRPNSSRLKLALLILRILKVLYPNIFIPGIFRVPIKGIVIYFRLK